MVIDNGNPEINANIFSLWSFHWVQKIFTTGYKRPLTEDDVFPIDPRLQSERLTALLEQQWLQEAERTKKPSLLVTLLKRHLYILVWVFVAAVIEGVLKCFVPFFVARITSYFDPATEMTQKTALLWSGGLLLLHCGTTVWRSYFFYRITRFGTSIRVAITGLIYRKACRITQRELGERSVGLIVNLITNDAQRLDEYIVPAYVLLNIWAVMGVSFLITYHEIGIYATLAGFTSLILFVPLQFYIGRLILYLREKIAPLTDSRVKIIHEIVSFMKIIKMYGWELMFRDLVQKVRLKEARFIGLFVLLRAVNITLLYISPIFSMIVVVTVKRYISEPLTTSEILFYFSMVGVIRVYLNVFLGHSLTFVPQVIHSLRRIQDFLNADEIQHLKKRAAIANLNNDVIINKNFIHKEVEVEDKNGLFNSENELQCFQEAVVIDNLSARWGPQSFSLSGVNLQVKKGELIAVVGPVACGKTSLLMSIIQELDNCKGTLRTEGSVGFSSQLPWIFNGDIEENIVFNRPLDREKLNKCIETCYLTRDIEQFPDGLYTTVGERGVQLSGGQRARVNLARAVYGDDPIILLDDPLSAVDSRCAKHIFNRLIKEHLCDKTRILVTHATSFLSEVDRIVVMDTDVVTDTDVVVMDTDVVVMDTDVVADGKKTKLVGRIAHVGTYNELVAQGMNLSMFGPGEKRSKRRRMRTMSKTSSKHRDEEEEEEEEEEESEEESVPDERVKQGVVKEEKKSGSLDKRLYFRYLALGLGYVALPVLLVALVAPPALDMYQRQYLIDWVKYKFETVSTGNMTPEELDAYDETHYETYLALGFGTIFLLLAKSVFFIFLVNRAGRRLHNRALLAVLRSPMRYFDTHPIGIIINRFSKDTYFMDERFPDVLLDFSGLLLLYIATLTLILIANYWFLFALIPIAAIMAFTVRYYLGTSIEIRRIEAIKRSPILSHISATLSGLTTIRANNQIEIYEWKHYLIRDEHTRCWMLFNAASRWLSVRLDCLTVLVSVSATFLCVGLRDMMGASVAGLALVYVNNMIGGVQWCVRQYSESENMMTAIERIFAFTELPPEALLESSDKAKYSFICNRSAPQLGVMEFRDVKLKYDPDGDYVLHGLSFITRPSEKIGVVGRTGAGKSTVLQALFRMVEPEGDVYLDGLLTRDMGLHELRRSISIIPQESLLFSATLRVNLDPFSEFPDQRIWDVLEKVELKRYVAAQAGGLHMAVQEGGGNLSAGQRQLLCLARALLRDNKFLVIDEATANVDEKTDQLIQRTLRIKFSDCTVLTIAHRINTIIDSDRVMVIEAGQLVEFDHPSVLLENGQSVFYDLVRETGMFDALFEQARASLKKKKSTIRCNEPYELGASDPFSDVALI